MIDKNYLKQLKGIRGQKCIYDAIYQCDYCKGHALPGICDKPKSETCPEYEE